MIYRETKRNKLETKEEILRFLKENLFLTEEAKEKAKDDKKSEQYIFMYDLTAMELKLIIEALEK